MSLRLLGSAALGPVVVSREMAAAEHAVFEEDPAFEAAAAVVLEGAVGDEFGVEAAVVGVVDLLGHDAVEGGADVGGGVGGIDGEGGSGLGEGISGGEDEEGESEAHGWEGEDEVWR